MSELMPEETEMTPADVVAPEEEPSSLMDSLRKQREEIAQNQEELFPVPGYNDPRLLVKYRLLDGTELEVIGKKISRQYKSRADRILYSSLDTFITACEGLYVENGNGEPVALEYPRGSGVALRFEEGLAEYLGFEANSAREVALGVFGGNEVAIMQHSILLTRWMGNTSIAVDDELLGEM